MPVLAGAGLDDPGIGALLQQSPAHHFDLEDDAFRIAREDDVAAAAEHELGRAAELGVIDHTAQRSVTVHSNQRCSQRRQRKRIQRAQVHVALDVQRCCCRCPHVRIFIEESRGAPI